METKFCIYIRELNSSKGWFMYVELLKHYKANIVWFLLNLCKYECGWGKL